MTHPLTSSSSPSHTILPECRCKWRVWRSKMKSVSNLLNFGIRSLIKLVFSSVSLLLWSLFSFKSSRRNSINTSFPVDMTFWTEFSFASFMLSFVCCDSQTTNLQFLVWYPEIRTHFLFPPASVSYLHCGYRFPTMPYSLCPKMFS